MGHSGNNKVMKQLAPVMNLGIELAVIIGVFGAIGWFIDTTFDTSPVWLVVLLVFGSIGGLYRFIRVALNANKQHVED